MERTIAADVGSHGPELHLDAATPWDKSEPFQPAAGPFTVGEAESRDSVRVMERIVHDDTTNLGVEPQQVEARL